MIKCKGKFVIKIIKFSGQGSHASSSTPQGRSLVDSLGGAAAPKFLKNWLTFAHSPYDPDHKSASGGPSAGLRGDNIQCPHFPPVARKHGNHFKQDTPDQ